MKFIRFLAPFILLTVVSFTGICQKRNKGEKPKEIAIREINRLKNGVLLVRLMTKSNSILALKERGQDEMANEVEQKQLRINQKTVEAFRENFNFCPVYFFFSDNTIAIKDKRLDEVVFLNDNLVPDSLIKLNTDNFLIAEFGKVEQDTGKQRGGYYYTKDETGLHKTAEYYAGPVYGFDALVIRSGEFVQMRQGRFPYYTRFWRGTRGYARTVAVANRKLNRFYQRHAK